MRDGEFDRIIREGMSSPGGDWNAQADRERREVPHAPVDRSRVAQKLASGCRVTRSGPLAAHALEQATIHLRIARKARQLDPGELQQVVEAFDEFRAELERARSWSLETTLRDQGARTPA